MARYTKLNFIVLSVIVLMLLVPLQTAYAEPNPTSIPLPRISFNLESSDSPEEVATSIQLLLLLTILSIAPSILVLMTSFTRVIITLSFIRNAVGTQQMPPNQVLIGLALFLTFFIMSPVFIEVNNQGLQPYINGEISQQAALDNSLKPIREFMFRQTREKDLALFVSMSSNPTPTELDDISTFTLIPAFVISEIKTAFQMGFILFIPFIVIDMVVASTLMSMGMMMLPPVMISLPFKILLFIMVDGWNLIIRSIILGFR